MKPVEFKIERTKTGEVFSSYVLILFYEDGTTESMVIENLPKGLELNRHYGIMDTYGYTVIDDRKGL